VDDAHVFFSRLLFSAVTLKEFDLDILLGLLSAWVLASGAPIAALRPRDLDRPRDFERDRELCTSAEKKDGPGDFLGDDDGAAVVLVGVDDAAVFLLRDEEDAAIVFSSSLLSSSVTSSTSTRLACTSFLRGR